MKRKKAQLVLADGTIFSGEQFGANHSSAGEVVFNTGMVGYPEAMTDPSYRGQILALTYPLIGNYGIPSDEEHSVSGKHSPKPFFESDAIQVSGLIVSSLSDEFSHWSAINSLESWMQKYNIPGMTGIDTRALTKHLRMEGSMLGKIIVDEKDVPWEDPNQRNLVAEVSTGTVEHYPSQGKKKVVLADFGCKTNILRRLTARGIDVIRVPWNYDWTGEQPDGVVFSNGPGDPKMCAPAVSIIKKGIEQGVPMFGICLGHQLLSLAAGADTYKMKFGHRSQNQPAIQVGTKRCYITSQNHGYAVNDQTMGREWKPWFFNANDGTNEGIRHISKPIFSVQFHPEASPGPTDTDFIFDLFVQALTNGNTY